MSTQSKIADDSKRFIRKPLTSTFRSSSGTAALYATILAIPKYNGTAATYVPQSTHTFKICAVSRDNYEETTITVLSKDDSTVSISYKKPTLFDLVVNDANGLLTLYGKCTNGGTSLIAYIEYSNNPAYIQPFAYQKFNVDTVTLTNKITLTDTTPTPLSNWFGGLSTGWTKTAGSQNRFVKFNGQVTATIDVNHAGETTNNVVLFNVGTTYAPTSGNNAPFLAYIDTPSGSKAVKGYVYNDGNVQVFGLTGATHLRTSFSFYQS